MGNSYQSDQSRTIEDLKAAFDARKHYFAHRSSCIFPVFIRPGTDLHIVFLNYWLLKNGIPADKIVVNFRVYAGDGSLVVRDTTAAISDHNQFSIRQMLSGAAGRQVDQFDGAVEVEIISTENLRFPFPGLIGIYQSGKLFSAVHAAGRVKNPDEPQRIIYTQESNWTCKFGDDVTPFFHYFNGPTVPAKNTIDVVLRSSNGVPVAQREVPIGHLPPFGSELFLVADLFDKKHFTEGSFVSVRVEHNSIFPRLVVGNLFRRLNYLEVTHSFPIIEKKDYCPVDNSVSFQSMLCAYTSPELDLEVNVFPTNCEGSFEAAVCHQTFDDKALKDKGRMLNSSTSISSDSIQFRLEPEERFLCLQMKGANVPSRFNGSYLYRVKGLDTRFSTDIADGADSWVYPPKVRHWGHAYIDDGFETAILIRNNSHTPEKTKDGTGTLHLYAAGFKTSVKIELPAESADSVNVGEVMGEFAGKGSDMPRFISWVLEMDVPTCETFWVAYRKTDGAIFGEHGM